MYWVLLLKRMVSKHWQPGTRQTQVTIGAEQLLMVNEHLQPGTQSAEVRAMDWVLLLLLLLKRMVSKHWQPGTKQTLVTIGAEQLLMVNEHLQPGTQSAEVRVMDWVLLLMKGMVSKY